MLLRGLFALVKSHSGQFRSVFFASAMLLHKLDLDAAGNSFIDVSDDRGFTACCGFTRMELKRYFAEHLRFAAAAKAGCAKEVVSDTQVEALSYGLEARCGIYAFDK